MTHRTISPGDRRTATMGALIIVVLIASLRGFPAWWEWRSQLRETTPQVIQELERARTQLAEIGPTLDTAEARVERLKRSGSFLLGVRDPSEGVAEVADIVDEAARLSSVRLDGLEERSGESSDRAARRVIVTGHGAADLRALTSLLHRIEAGPPLLSLTQVSIRPRDMGVSVDTHDLLDLRFTVEAMIWVVREATDEAP